MIVHNQKCEQTGDPQISQKPFRPHIQTPATNPKPSELESSQLRHFLEVSKNHDVCSRPKASDASGVLRRKNIAGFRFC